MTIIGKRLGGRGALFLASSVLALTTAAGSAWSAPALPTGGAVTAGSATIGSTASALTVNQTSAKGVITWQGFSIGQGGAVQINNGSGATLNRVTGASVSSIDGLLSATGSVYLINPNGIIIGKTGVVNTGGSFVASTLDVANSSFLAGGPLGFTGGSTASVVNLGKVGALGGNIALIATTVANSGALTAANGTVGLAAGSSVTLTDSANDDGGLLSVQLGGPATSVTTSGLIQAAAAELRAQQGNIFALAGNTGGAIDATGVDGKGGRIWLVSQGGTASIAGTLDAQGAGAKPGQIETSGQTLDIGQASVNTHGGTWLLDPSDITITGANVGTLETALTTGNVVEDTSTGSGGSGNITVNAPITWSSGFGLTLNAVGALAINAPITIAGAGQLTLNFNTAASATGGLSFGLTSAGFAGSVSYAVGTGEGVSGQALTINGQAYNLIYSMADLAGIGGGSAYALATPLISTTTYTDAVVSELSGTLEGLGNTITGLTIVTSDTNAGLINELDSGGLVRDIGLVGGKVSGAVTVGDLVAGNNGTVETSYATGAVSGSQFVGGLVGFQEGAIKNSYATGAVSGGSSAGGLLGFNDGGSVSASYATGAVSANDTAGGLIGTNDGGPVSASYATGAVSANNTVGGLIGENNSALVSASYATGAVSGASTVGGLIGSDSSGTISASYWDTQTTGQGASPDGGTGLTTAQFKSNFGGYMSTLGAAFGGGTGGFFPYLATFFPNGVQAVTGTLSAAPASQVGLYSGGVLLGQGTTSVGADGSYYLAVPAGTFATAGPNRVGDSLALPTTAGNGVTVAAVGALSYTDAAPVSGGILTLPAFTAGTVSETTGASSYGELQTDLAITFGAGALAPLQTALANAPVTVTSANASGFTVDQSLTLASSLTLATTVTGAPITVSAPITLTGSNSLTLSAADALNIDAPINVVGGGQVTLGYSTSPTSNTLGARTGGLSFGLTSAGFTGSLSYAVGTGEGVSGQALTINGQAYNLVYSMADLAGIGGAYAPAGNTTNYALATPLTSTTTYTDPVVSSFSGALEGLGQTITGLTINSGDDEIGLIGTLNSGGLVRDLGLVGGSVSGGTAVGALMGANSGTVETSYATGTVSGSVDIGGLVGENVGAISTSYATGAVSGSAGTGGLIGINGGPVSTSYATGAISGTESVGGLIGANVASGTVSTSYATGAVSGLDVLGGLVGANQGAVLTSYATGPVSASGNSGNVGGLVGDAGGTVSTSYWDTQTTGQSASPEGGTGLTTAQFKSNSGGYMSTLGAAFGGGTGGLYPYLTAFFPNGVQAVAGSLSAAPGSQVGLYSGGVLLGQGTTSVGADGSYYLAVQAGTFSTTGPNKVGDSLAPPTAAVGALSYTDAATESGGVLTLPAFTAGTISETSGDASYGALQTDLAATFGTGGLSILQTTSVNTPVVLTSTNTGGFTIDRAVNAGGGFNLVSADPLTLAATGSITAGAGADITLSTQASFVNQAGAAALTTSGGGRWLVYSANPATDTFDSLNSNNMAVWNTAAGAPVTASGDRYVFAFAPTLTLTATSDSKTYGQDFSAALQSDYTITGLEPGVSGAYLGDTAAAVYSGAPTISSTGSGQTASVAGGPYAIVAAAGTLAVQDGYALSIATGGQLSVNAASLIISANNASTTYGGSSLPGLGVGYAGFVAGDTASSLTTAPTVATTATAYNGTAGSGSNAGSYAITASGAVDGNYIIAYTPGSLTVNPAALTIAANNASTIYGGSALPALSASYTGLANGDTPSSLTTAPSLATTATAYNGAAGSGSNAGSYAVTASGAVDGNYIIAYTPGSLTVNPAALTIAASSASTTYGGSNLPALSASYTGLANGDTASSLTTAPSLVTTATAYNGTAGSGSNAGTYAVTASGAVDGNYTIAYTPGSLTVNPAALTIAANNVSTTYGGSTLPLPASYTGLVNGDTASSLTTAPSLATTATAYNGTAGSGSNAGSYAVTASGAVDGNYTIAYTPGSLTVNPAALTIAANNASTTYGGSALPALSASYTGLANGDTPSSLTTAPSLATTATAYNGAAGSGSNAGSYAVTASGAVDGNYTIAYTPGSLTVNRASITVAALGGISTSGASPANPGLSATGLQNGDTTTVLGGLDNSFGITSSTPAGAYVLTVLGTLTDPNYTVASTSPGAWTVSAAAASVGPTPTLTTVAGVLPETGGFTTLNGLVPGVTPQIGLLRLVSLAQTPDKPAPACASSSVDCPGAPYPNNLQVGPGIRFVASK